MGHVTFRTHSTGNLTFKAYVTCKSYVAKDKLNLRENRTGCEQKKRKMKEKIELRRGGN
ncbi:uncharacterized protein G2W53_023630 [Senna tora]|uniref:Uncharacterized protein n=1 Tax=Senna tora TaxID=362788 RepID=A0A834TAF7_9FABA|nr:uncharacterized protein G2W53_023630 [Senna tora]